jgi:hypothetical protein
MRHKASNRKILIGSWILLGLMILGFNGYKMLVLMDVPLSGYSDSVRSVDRGIRELNHLLAAENEKIEKGLKELSVRYSPKEKMRTVSKKSVPKPMVKRRPKKKTFTTLPVLTGILTKWTTNGEAKHLALLDGLVCSEGDKVSGLTIEKISTKGIRLNKKGKTWFIEAPGNSYSLALQ